MVKVYSGIAYIVNALMNILCGMPEKITRITGRVDEPAEASTIFIFEGDDL